MEKTPITPSEIAYLTDAQTLSLFSSSLEFCLIILYTLIYFINMPRKSGLDEIGPWSEMKLAIISKYAEIYSTILKNYPSLKYSYIDAFAGAGIHKRKKTGEGVLGSPLHALQVIPKFEHFYFIDNERWKVEFLRRHVGMRNDVTFEIGDANEILPKKVFPNVKYEDFKRALCFLDPYGLHLDWNVIQRAGEMKSIEIFLNFPSLDIQRNLLLKNPKLVKELHLARMTRFWGDDSWRKHVYKNDLPDLFGETALIHTGIENLVKAFRDRLRQVAGFKYVPNPVPFHDDKRTILYYIYFATQNETAYKVVNYMFTKYRRTGTI